MTEAWMITGRGNFPWSYPIQVKRHISPNSSWEIVNTDSLDDMPDKEIQPALVD
jgi:hypothetical protein